LGNLNLRQCCSWVAWQILVCFLSNTTNACSRTELTYSCWKLTTVLQESEVGVNGGKNYAMTKSPEGRQVRYIIAYLTYLSSAYHVWTKHNIIMCTPLFAAYIIHSCTIPRKINRFLLPSGSFTCVSVFVFFAIIIHVYSDGIKESCFEHKFVYIPNWIFKIYRAFRPYTSSLTFILTQRFKSFQTRLLFCIK